jgi:serine protease AprX
MLRNYGGTRGETRSSALWGTGGRGGESRSNALWGKGGRGLVTMLAAVFLLGVPLAAGAKDGSSGDATYISPSLMRLAAVSPGAKIKVIIQSSDSTSDALEASRAAGGSLHRRLGIVRGVATEIPAARLKSLSRMDGLTITSDAPVKVSGTTALSNDQIWPYEAGLAKLWGTAAAPAPGAPTIAVVDSGIQADRADFAGRIAATVNLSTLPGNSPGDGRGHGTFVAGIAAGASAGYAGAAPNAKLVAIDVMDDHGMARTSDVIAACNWILANKQAYNIRVANFSLHSATPSNFYRDPLDKAVEKLWFNNVVVVAAAGNYGIPTGPSRVMYAPGNDPFVITVGAVDIGNTVGLGNDSAAPWSAYGYTYDGFWKPEIGAAGRYMIGPVPAGSTLAIEKAANVTAPGYIQLSGTSFAAPAVAGAAAQLLARNPSLTPDEVKGALMLSAKPVPNAIKGSVGVGELNAAKAAQETRLPNPNAALNRFLVSESGGSGKVFDSVSWTDAARASVSWDSVSWTDVSWTDAAWSLVSWTDVSWTDVSWTDVSWTDASMGDVSWLDVSWEDAAEGDANSTEGYNLSPADVAELNADPDLAVAASLLPADLTSSTTPLPLP